MKKFQSKLDSLFWLFVLCVPFFGYFVANYRASSPVAFLTYCDAYSFSFIKNIFNSVWQTVFSENCVLAGLLSYFVMVECVHVLFDLIVFIPRFAHQIGDRLYLKG